MKITDVAVFPFPIAMREPFRIATMVSERSPNLLVRISTDEGLTGWGEASPLHAITGETPEICVAAARVLKGLLLGKDPLAVQPLGAEMERFLPHNSTIRGAFDVALYDIAARAAGMPLYRFLGGERHVMETDLTIGIGDPDAAGASAEAVLAQGFRIIKVKVGTTLEQDRRRLANIRRAVGPNVRLRIDANQGYDRLAAITALNDFADLDIEFCEQPVKAHDVAGLALVSRSALISVMADEALFSPADAIRLLAADAAPCFNIKLSKSGGIRGALRVAAIAEAGGIACMMGCMLESRLGLTAAAHCACACEAVRFYDLDSCFEYSDDPIVGGIRYDSGVISLPDTPGIGAEPAPELVMRLANVV